MSEIIHSPISMATTNQKLRKTFLEPRIYALVLQSKHGSVLHLGIYYSLDEAIDAGKQAFFKLTSHKPEDFISLDIWDSMPGDRVLKAITDSTTSQNVPKAISAADQIKMIRASKNKLMKSLIEEKSLGNVELARNLLTKNEKALIEEKIKAITASANTIQAANIIQK